MSRTGNLGAAPVPRRRRKGDAMQRYDRLPAPLRAWIAGAVLPWSPVACLAIWRRMRAAGYSVEASLAALDAAECRTLARHAPGPSAPPPARPRPYGVSRVRPASPASG